MRTQNTVSRRRLLALSAAAGTGLAIGAAASPAAAHNVVQYSTIFGQPTYYEDLNTGTATRTNFFYNSTFHSQLDTWLMDWYGYTPSNWVQPVQVWSNGVHVDGSSGTTHPYGRAIDLSRILVRNYNTGANITGFYSRYDIWRYWSGSSLITTAKYYWGTVASLNRHFGVVLSHLYNSQHHNHVHADNSEPNTFNLSRSQVLMVQAVCNNVWGVWPFLTTDGVWGSRTDTNSRFVLQRIGLSGGLTTSTANWHSFCMTSLGQATGRFNY